MLGGLGWKADEVKIESGPMVCLPLDRLDRLLLRHLLTYATAEVLFKHRVLALDQDESQARVEVEIEATDGTKSKSWMSADYVVGSDGANSQIRRSLFGDMNYPGETLEKQIIATNVCSSPAPFPCPPPAKHQPLFSSHLKQLTTASLTHRSTTISTASPTGTPTS